MFDWKDSAYFHCVWYWHSRQVHTLKIYQMFWTQNICSLQGALLNCYAFSTNEWFSHLWAVTTNMSNRFFSIWFFLKNDCWASHNSATHIFIKSFVIHLIKMFHITFSCHSHCLLETQLTWFPSLFYVKMLTSTPVLKYAMFFSTVFVDFPPEKQGTRNPLLKIYIFFINTQFVDFPFWW